MQKGISAIFLIILLTFFLGIIFIGVGYVVTGEKAPVSLNLNPPKISKTPNPKPSPTVYQNKDLGFQITIPAGFISKEDSEEKFNKRGNGNFRKNFTGYVLYEPANVLGAVVILDKNDQNYEDAPVSIWIFENKDNLKPEDFYNKFWYYPFVWGDFTSNTKSKYAPNNEEKLKIFNEYGKSAILDYQVNKPKFIYLRIGGEMYLFRVLNNNNNAGAEVLNSFKLLE